MGLSLLSLWNFGYLYAMDILDASRCSYKLHVQSFVHVRFFA